MAGGACRRRSRASAASPSSSGLSPSSRASSKMFFAAAALYQHCLNLRGCVHNFGCLAVLYMSQVWFLQWYATHAFSFAFERCFFVVLLRGSGQQDGETQCVCTLVKACWNSPVSPSFGLALLLVVHTTEYDAISIYVLPRQNSKPLADGETRTTPWSTRGGKALMQSLRS